MYLKSDRAHHGHHPEFVFPSSSCCSSDRRPVLPDPLTFLKGFQPLLTSPWPKTLWTASWAPHDANDALSASITSLASQHPKNHTFSLLFEPPLFFALLHQALGLPYPNCSPMQTPTHRPIFTLLAHRQLQPSLSAGFHNTHIYIYIYLLTFNSFRFI